ncbi:YciI family protein [Arsenicicoccus dermatophilus]|uniref:YciI family protein n=1 Tax=Arsenicicoccus dermatophilus TaxID=1076331 RepID=UPI00391706B3
MAFYAVRYTYADDPRLDEVRPTHREFLGSLVERGLLKASGPYVGTTPASALLIFEAGSADEVRSTLEQDPFQHAGLVTGVDVTEWNPVIGVFAS